MSSRRSRGRSVSTSAPFDDPDQGRAGSPDEEGVQLQKLIGDMMNATRRRREAKRKSVETECATQEEAMKTKLTDAYDRRNQKIAAVRVSQIEKLRALVRKKGTIENYHDQSIKVLVSSFSELVQVLDVVASSRLKEMEAIGKADSKVEE
ncbi:MAG: hypothetical protein M1814_003156 [Vezdaea aestivalis]|nr:MAG: hypothetical protein M1814_003156 [Vezdaea aestivalis]